MPPPAKAGARVKTGEFALSTLVVGFICIFLSRVDAFAFGHQIIAARPIAIFIGGAIPIVLASVSYGRGVEAVVRARHALLPLGAMVLVGLLNSLFNQTSESADIRLSYGFVVAALVFVFGVTLAGLGIRPWVWRVALSMALVITCATILWDGFVPGSFSVLQSRAAGLGENPNVGALTAVLLLASCLSWDRRSASWVDGFALLLTGVSVFLTQSRGGVLSLILVAGAYLYSRAWRTSILLPVVAASALGTLVLIASVAGGPMSDILSGEGRSGLVVRGDEAYDDSAQERLRAVTDSIELIAQHPLLGWGNGHTMSIRIGPHNMFLSRWLDNGILGLLTYCWWLATIVVLSWKARNTEALILTLVVVLHSFLSHNLLDDRTVLILMGRSVGLLVLTPNGHRVTGIIGTLHR
jgi:O-antigen ligase